MWWNDLFQFFVDHTKNRDSKIPLRAADLSLDKLIPDNWKYIAWRYSMLIELSGDYDAQQACQAL